MTDKTEAIECGVGRQPGGIFPLIFTLRRTQSLHVSSGSGQALRVVLLARTSDRKAAHGPERSAPLLPNRKSFVVLCEL
jgi:hypothetical protein